MTCQKRGKEVYYRVNYPYCAEVLRVVHEFVSTQDEFAAVRGLGTGLMRAP